MNHPIIESNIPKKIKTAIKVIRKITNDFLR